ncbi:MAG: hypothetical protein ACI8RN_002643 [Glaciecola sp.]
MLSAAAGSASTANKNRFESKTRREVRGIVIRVPVRDCGDEKYLANIGRIINQENPLKTSAVSDVPLLLRLSIFLLMFVWTLDKFVNLALSDRDRLWSLGKESQESSFTMIIERKLV